MPKPKKPLMQDDDTPFDEPRDIVVELTTTVLLLRTFDAKGATSLKDAYEKAVEQTKATGFHDDWANTGRRSTPFIMTRAMNEKQFESYKKRYW